MEQDKIIVRGARVHNLKNMNVDIPKNKLVVITGLSGSGKSSLAFNTIFAEGQRRYLESLSSYARQFLDQMDKPDVDRIEGLSPAIAIEQKSVSHNPRSTVGTVTEIHDYLRLLFASVGRPYCYKCGKEITSQAVEQMVDSIICGEDGSRFMVLAPIVRGRKGEYRKELDELRKSGFVRIRVNGELRELSEEIKLARHKKHNLEVVVDRLVLKSGIKKRLADSLETALALAGGIVMISWIGGSDVLYSSRLSCIDCGISYPDMAPRLFSFNSPHGACAACDGIGSRMDIDQELLVPDERKSFNAGAITLWEGARYRESYSDILEPLARHYGFSLDTPFKDLPQAVKDLLFHGNGRGGKTGMRFEGIISRIRRRYRTTVSNFVRMEIEKYMTNTPCDECGGARLRKESLAIRVGGLSIAEVSRLNIGAGLEFFSNLSLSDMEKEISGRILREVIKRLSFLLDVGLDYITLDRTAYTLSGGEGQRIRLATQIGSGLTGVLYVLDEPSIGLHQRDNMRLLGTLLKLRDLGNTVLVVEHDEEMIRAADYVIDIGPRAGEHGGEIVAAGPPEHVINSRSSLTGSYLRGESVVSIPRNSRKPEKFFTIRGAEANNLKKVKVSFPLGMFTSVTGVSGSGKSSLVVEVLYKNLASLINRSSIKGGKYEGFDGIEMIDKVIDIDHSPIGRTPRSNPATYTGLFTPIRELFAKLPESNIRGYKPGRYSFNVKGGRCNKCDGDGVIKVEMHFLPDVFVTCELCQGKRYNRETLEIKYKGKNIAQVLHMTVEEAGEFFKNIPMLKKKLSTLVDVGLDYIRLGQAATTLSGGEAQRVKLAKELSKRDTGKTMYILDEPTTGLHFADIQHLLNVLNRLVESGNTVIVIEHNLDVIRNSDYLVDLGPEGGEKGGNIIATGSPEEVAQNKNSYTGQYLRRYWP